MERGYAYQPPVVLPPLGTGAVCSALLLATHGGTCSHATLLLLPCYAAGLLSCFGTNSTMS